MSRVYSGPENLYSLQYGTAVASVVNRTLCRNQDHALNLIILYLYRSLVILFCKHFHIYCLPIRSNNIILFYYGTYVDLCVPISGIGHASIAILLFYYY